MEQKPKEKVDPMGTSSPEEYWNSVIKVNKNNMNSEEQLIKQYDGGVEKIQGDEIRNEKLCKMEEQELEIIQRLYKEHGEDYVNTDEWKDFMVNTKLKFALNNVKSKRKHQVNLFKEQLNVSKRNISVAQDHIKTHKKYIKEANEKKKLAVKDKSTMTG